jgi:hypothetical protein
MKYRPTMRTWIWTIIAILAWAMYVAMLALFTHVIVPPMWIGVGTVTIIFLAILSGFRFRSAGR